MNDRATRPANPDPARRRAQIDNRRAAVLVALVLAFIAGHTAGQPTEPPLEPTCSHTLTARHGV